MRVIIITGGKGTRLGEFTRNKPKHLLTIGQIPLLVYTLKQLECIKEVSSIEIITGWFGDLIEDEIKKYAFSKSIDIIKDVECPGSWWPFVYKRLQSLTSDESVMVWVGDLFAFFDISDCIKNAEPHRNKFVALTFETRYAGLRRGIFETNSQTGQVLYSPEKITKRNDLINVGIYFFQPQLLTPSDVYLLYPEKNLFPRLIEKNLFVSFKQKGYAININTPIELFFANMSIFLNDHRKTFDVSGNQSISKSAYIHESAVIGDLVIIGDGAIVGEKAKLARCVICPNTQIDPNTRIKDVIVGPSATYSVPLEV